MPQPIHNFSAGPAMLPVEVRERLADALTPGADGSPSIAEVSHRGPRFMALAEELFARLRDLMEVGEKHEVLLLHGGANLQFAWLPMNLARDRTAAYLLTGHWGEKAMAEAARVSRTTVVGSSADIDFIDLPEMGHLPADCAYLHYTGNETIHGLQFPSPPRVGVPLAADLSSEFLSRPYPYRDLAFAYAGAQKNLGIAGVTVVLIRRDLLERIPDDLPRYLDYRAWVESGSMFNTPVTLAWFVALEMLRWIEEQGGLEVMAAASQARSKKLYSVIDASDFYRNGVADHARSTMNVPFFLPDEALTPRFVSAAEAAGLSGLKGHRAVGGLRASLYNAQTMEAVETLVDFMQEFEKRHG
ncbi:3-phosphoserine/phosphohydroxythreonine transaminase [Wenzhouxiangella sp. AB-CW3]|uniref:3-phosphoserine/phosphohydroxythreonine transaminase n=1 Tax=Wenzhouxiangella sp. AB-CW3 TaxID=2771012 RepID=UPI00168B6C4A|nr:3-phosphoserine/phosphohydroxythreonine transaminase [Wenzhouxiangella sp. AB-CW3]QOC21657.1 3-phosphoserine/phosphohydroxythreonine transaminase [Wenzhouxiangella sp. AB-CW3]